MLVKHQIGILSSSKEVNENVGFLLTNKRGSYCIFCNEPASRYHGLFYFDNATLEMYKFIESIEPVGHKNIQVLANGLYCVERKNGILSELFLMPKDSNSLIYELSAENEVDIILDCKKSYDNRTLGRYYEIFEEGGCIVVKFTKKTDEKEDNSHDVEEFGLYLAIKFNSQSYTRNDFWVERYYSFDAQRNSFPFRRHVYNAIRIKGSRFVFSMSKNKNDAIRECNYVFDNLEELKTKEKYHFFNFLKNESIKKIMKNDKIGKEIKISYANAMHSLNSLIVDGKNTGLFAGLPWFFQFWSRDTLISLKSLPKINEDFAKDILFRYLNEIKDDGRLANLAGQYISKNLGNADSHGWLFLRCSGLVKEIHKSKKIVNSIKASSRVLKSHKNINSTTIEDYLKNFSSIVNKKEDQDRKVIHDIESSIETSHHRLLKFHFEFGFETNEKLETWMDTEFENDARSGARIEIQALRLSMYKLMCTLSQNPEYRVLEDLLKKNVRKKFWDGKVLADGLNDFTIRPNIFLAAYAYNQLLKQNEWEACFDNALKSLWLEWGGIATIDKNHPLFTSYSTGENIKSYHRGDSWFWINNLTALVLNRINRKKYRVYIKKIIESSTEEILWKGCVGCHSELSSAKHLESNGCFNQAWSNAMYMELIDEVLG